MNNVLPEVDPRKEANGSGALAAGGLAAILASACCVGPLVLLSLGFGGAWIANLTVLTPYRPVFIGLALLALFFAGRRIFRPAAECKPGEVCAVPQVKAAYKLLFWAIAALVLVGLVFPWIAPWFY
ncbi:MAG: mercuric ion transporter MerT [Rhizobacter sp.]|nr:mercuric ion transporter MerT [Rhizobacter sp.]